MQNRRLEPTGQAKLGEIRRLTGTVPGLAPEESAGRVFGRFWNRTYTFLRGKPGPVANTNRAAMLPPLLVFIYEYEMCLFQFLLVRILWLSGLVADHGKYKPQELKL
jgi:hypothetical protein